MNRTKSIAVGVSLDISNAIPWRSKISILGTNDYSKIIDSKVVVITASTGIYKTSRTELLKEQISMIKKIAKNIHSINPNCVFLVISNPVDVLTYLFQKETSFSSKRIIGIASSLDSARFRYFLSKHFDTNQSNFSDVWVLGEHGNSMVPIFSRVKLEQERIIRKLTREQVFEITNQVKYFWKTLRKYKNRSAYGIAKHTYDVLESIIKNKEIFLPASTMLNGEYGESSVCMGIPLVIDKRGVKSIKKIDLNKLEKSALHTSAQAIKNYIQKTNAFQLK